MRGGVGHVASDAGGRQAYAPADFPEIDIDKVSRMSGLDISFVTTANTDNEAFELLKEMGIPFKK